LQIDHSKSKYETLISINIFELLDLKYFQNKTIFTPYCGLISNVTRDYFKKAKNAKVLFDSTRKFSLDDIPECDVIVSVSLELSEDHDYGQFFQVNKPFIALIPQRMMTTTHLPRNIQQSKPSFILFTPQPTLLNTTTNEISDFGEDMGWIIANLQGFEPERVLFRELKSEYSKTFDFNDPSLSNLDNEATDNEMMLEDPNK